MNASRHICCHAANAFRPAAALRNVFYGPIGRRCASGSSSASPSQRRSRAGVRSTDVFEQGRKSGSKQEQSHERGIATALEDYADHVDNQVADNVTIEEHAEEYSRRDGGIDGQGRDFNAASDAPDELYIRRKSRVPSEGSPAFQSPKLEDIAEKKLAGHGKEVLEYEGQYVQPSTLGKKVVTKDLTWLRGLDLENGDIPVDKRLGAEVEAFAKWIRPTEAEIAARESVIKQTMSIVQKNSKNFKVETFGSSRNGLGLANSDIDLRLYQEWETDVEPENWVPKSPVALPPKWQTRKINHRALRHLQQRFFKHPDYIMCNIRFARYPLLHMQHKPSGIDVQIVCANDTSAQRKWIKVLLETRPSIADLYSVIKTLLEVRGLMDVFRGGLGSYAVLIMIVAALNKAKYDATQEAKKEGTAHLDQHDPHQKLAQDLLQFFRFWGWFDTYKSAVLADPVVIVPKIDPKAIERLDHKILGHQQLRILDQSQPYLLCLTDPGDATNDLGRQAYGWKHIQETFRYLYRGLSAKVRPGYDKKLLSFLAPLVGAAHVEYQLRRRQAEAYGKEALLSPAGVVTTATLQEGYSARRVNLRGKKPLEGTMFRAVNLDSGVEDKLENDRGGQVEEEAEAVAPETSNAEPLIKEGSQAPVADETGDVGPLDRAEQDRSAAEGKAAASA